MGAWEFLRLQIADLLNHRRRQTVAGTLPGSCHFFSGPRRPPWCDRCYADGRLPWIASRWEISACLALVCSLALLLPGCGRGATTIAKSATVGWKRVGSWTGHGNVQTETFTSDTGGFRVLWQTRNEAPHGAGRLKVIFRSGDSGREIMDAVDVRGNGSGTADVADRPRWYYLTIEAANLEWTVTVEEPVELAAR